MRDRPLEKGRLEGWKAIAGYVGRTERTVIRWEKSRGLPVHRLPGGHRNAVFAYPHEIEAWREGEQQSPPSESGSGPEATPERDNNALIEPVPVVPDLPVEKDQSVTARVAMHPRRPLGRLLLLVAAVPLVALCTWAGYRAFGPKTIRFSGLVQLTNDGVAKEGLVTDGRNLYFGERRQGKIVLATVSASGGPVSIVSDYFVQALPADLSPDGANLMVLVREGAEDEDALWIMPAHGGLPHRLGDVRCHSAVWSPDGRRIAFAFQNSIFITEDNGATARQLQSFNGTPVGLHWFPNGLGLRFTLRDSETVTFSFWEIAFSDVRAAAVASLRPLNLEMENTWEYSTTLDDRGRSFVSAGALGERRNLFLIDSAQSLIKLRYTLKALDSPLSTLDGMALDIHSKRIFAEGDSSVPAGDRRNCLTELFLYDARSHSTQPFLAGVSAIGVDFSKDGKWIVYVRTGLQGLWISHPDGTALRRIETPSDDLELPHWSPDGKYIAYMARLAGKPWRIFVSAVSGGRPREVTGGSDAQGAPSWSPDGKQVAFGNVHCHQTGACAIHTVDLATGRVTTLPGSGGLTTARWSPDGRFIAALNIKTQEVFLFSVASRVWRNLHGGITGNDLSWSADSRAVYASRPVGTRPEILRIPLLGASETAVNLADFTKLNGHIDTWFAMAPGDSVIFMRSLGSDEIYSFSYIEK